jgi:phosphoserine phosphatase
MPPLTRVILVRHGRSTFNEQGRYQGSSNQAVLTPTGLATSQLVGQYLKQLLANKPIDIMYSSPLHRVQQTVYEIAKAIPLAQRPPMVISDELREISLSLWEGLTYAQVKQQFGEQYQCWQQRPHEFELPVNSPEPAGKSIAVATKTYFPVQDLYQTAQQFWRNILPKHLGSTILIVSHSGTIHALLSTALGISPAHHHSLQQSNCGVSELTFSGHEVIDQSVKLHQLNQTVALKETLPKLKASKHGLRLILLASEGLSSSSCQHLAERLKAASVDFCLSTDEAQQWIELLTQYHRQILNLGVQKADFLQDWQHSLCQSRQLSETLITGLAIAPTTSIQKLLMQTMSGAVEKSDRLAIRPKQLSVIHYSHGQHRVVQTING